MCLVDVDQVESLITDGANDNEKESENDLAPIHFAAGAGKLYFLSYSKITMKTFIILSF